MVSRAVSLPALKGVRGARFDDAPHICRMVNETMAQVFGCEGVLHIRKLIERSVYALCLVDVRDRLAGFIAAKDYPLVPAVHPSAWEEFIWLRYKTTEMRARNSLFIHLLCWEPAHGREAVDGLLRPIFMMDPHLAYIGFIKQPPDYPCLVPGQMPAEASFRRVNAVERGAPDARPPALYIAQRAGVAPRLRVRRAVEEDNDDIIPIIERQSKRLRALYGEFYVSELIARHPESERVLLVCEHNQLAVGVMCLNTTINYEVLEENFDLMPFAGLKKIDKQQDLVTEEEHEREAKFEVVEPLNCSESFHQSFLGEGIRQPKVSLAEEFESIIQSGQDSPMLSWRSIQVDQLFQDEEDIEFDIINIDEALLAGSQMMPLDAFSVPSEAKSSVPGPSLTGLLAIHEDEIDRNVGFRDRSKSLKVVRYSGPSNSFLIELFAMHPDYDERHGFDMLEAAFELFPDRDYCIMSLPTDHPTFPLLEHFTFVNPSCCKNRFKGAALYVAHVNSVRGHLEVRPAENFDLPTVIDLLEHSPGRSSLTELFRISLESHTVRPYIFLSESQPLGFGVVGPLDEGISIRALFELNHAERCIEEDGLILAANLSPVLEPHSRWLTRELLRFTNYTTLFWVTHWASKDARILANLMSFTNKMAPIRPRRFSTYYCTEELVDLRRESAKSTLSSNVLYAVWYLERPLTGIQKVDINTAIVVVGASSTGLAFLETILTGPSSKYLRFTNVCLVSECGLPVVNECINAAETCVPRVTRYCDEYVKCMPFYYYVDVVTGLMDKIDRQKKCIHIKGGMLKYYDELVLTCGEQFQHPDYLKASLERDKELMKGKPCERVLMDDPNYLLDPEPPVPEVPVNVMIINSLIEANLCMRRLAKFLEIDDESLLLNSKNPIVVYGDCVEAYSCLAALLQLGIPPNFLVFIEPFPPDTPTKMRVNCFNNETVDKRVQKSIEDLGICVYRRCTLVNWTLTSGTVTSVKVVSPKNEVVIPCFAIFYYGVKGIDLHTFKAIVLSGLVYDGGTVVSTEFGTNDPDVFAAGPGTTLDRWVRAPHRRHSNYCSEDVGEALGKLFLKKLDPYFVDDKPEEEIAESETLETTSSSKISSETSSSSQNLEAALANWEKKWRPGPTYDSPIVVSSTLPGPLYYLKVRPPGPEIPMEVQLSLPKKGHILVTDRDGNYFRLQLNGLHVVCAITCLSHKPFLANQLVKLYGKHESLFHHLLRRFTTSLIEDLFCYFTQPWMSTIYQEAFEESLVDIDEPKMYTQITTILGRSPGCYIVVDDIPTPTQPVPMREPYGFRPRSPQRSPLSPTSRSKLAETATRKGEIVMGGKRPPKLERAAVVERPVMEDSRVLQLEKDADDEKETFREKLRDIVRNTPNQELNCTENAWMRLRAEARAVWNKLEGERNIIDYIGHYLHTHSVENAQYSVPILKQDFFSYNYD